MSRWTILLGGLAVWTAHFFLLYAFASILPGDPLANWLTVAATVVALALDAILLRAAMALLRGAEPQDLDRWIGKLGATGASLSGIAVLWQMLPAII